MIPYKLLSLADIFSDYQEKFENDKPAFLSLLETHIDIDEFIPISFRNHFYHQWAFCYVFKFGIVTNGLGIIRHISFITKIYGFTS